MSTTFSSITWIMQGFVLIVVLKVIDVFSVRPLLLSVVVFYVFNALLVVLIVHVLLWLHFLFDCLVAALFFFRWGFILWQVVQVKWGHNHRLLPQSAHIRSAVYRLETIIWVEWEHEAALIVSHVVLILRHNILESDGWDVLDTLFLIEFIDGHTLVLEGKEEEEELVFLVFVISDLLVHLGYSAFEGLHLDHEVCFSFSDHIFRIERLLTSADCLSGCFTLPLWLVCLDDVLLLSDNLLLLLYFEL